eukprot:TRINITY_DN2332_c1_g1_i2.p1 TRINITY_DN2332_c1_g1~~TRINITY_DN2332_c1_g1_i2.p1  ORF type:complete len:598 (-),score=140.95 TRINITY_DN2332_c1_g1_i2:26-1819(-)
MAVAAAAAIEIDALEIDAAGSPAAEAETEHEAESPQQPLRADGHTIFRRFSRFNRDRSSWIATSDAVLWELSLRATAEGRSALNCWSCGCSSGEEAYYLRMMWQRRLASIFPSLDLTVFGTDLSAEKVEAARLGGYPQHSVQGLPPDWQTEFFDVPATFSAKHALWRFANQSDVSTNPDWHGRQKEKLKSRQLERSRAAAAIALLPGAIGGGRPGGEASDWLWRLRDPALRGSVSFAQQDVTEEMPDGPFDVILSRYAVCLYLEGDQKVEVLSRMVERLREGGFLVLGAKDKLPLGFCERHALVPLVYRTLTEACPFGPPQLVDGIFRKMAASSDAFSSSSSPAPALAVPAGGSTGTGVTSPCPRDFATYSAYLQACGREADWLLERDRAWRERTEKKLTTRSRQLLERAAEAGRLDADASLVSRMLQDAEARKRRAQDAERLAAERLAEEALGGVARPAPISRMEASQKLQSFFERMGSDLAQRQRSAKAAKKAQERADRRSSTAGATAGAAPLAHRRRRRSRSAVASSAARVPGANAASARRSSSSSRARGHAQTLPALSSAAPRSGEAAGSPQSPEARSKRTAGGGGGASELLC